MNTDETKPVSTVESRAKGALYGCAVGDALGLPGEWKTREQIAKIAENDYGHWPRNYIRTERPKRGEFFEAGQWSDDTEASLMVVNAFDGKNLDLEKFKDLLQEWVMSNPKGIGSYTKEVIAHARFMEKGNLAARDVFERHGKDAASNGGVMRAAVVGILRPDNIAWTVQTSIDVCAITHVDPRCLISSALISAVTAALVSGKEVNDAFLCAENAVYRDHFSGRPQPSVRYLISVADNEGLDCLPYGYTYKTAGAGLRALYNASMGWKSPLVRTICEGGDADTNGAVAGALLGAWGGFEGIPDNLVEGLIERQRLDDALMKMKARQDDAHGVGVGILAGICQEERQGGCYMFAPGTDERLACRKNCRKRGG